MVSARQKGTGPEGTIVLATNNNYSVNKFSSLTDFQANIIRLGIGFSSVTEQDVLWFQISMDYPLVL
jgi:hypothetical protein